MTSGRWVALDVDSQDLLTVHTDGKEQHDIIRFSPGTAFQIVQQVYEEFVRKNR